MPRIISITETKVLGGTTEWLDKQLNPPEVFLCAYTSGGGFKMWRCLKMMSHKEYVSKTHEEWAQWARRQYASAIAVKLYKAEG